jgi:hypothetical protein
VVGSGREAALATKGRSLPAWEPKAVNNESFDVPDAFVADLLNLKIDDLAHISLDGENTVLTMRGSGGEKAYEVHFHFKGKRLAQRILEYSEARNVIIRENR